MIVPPAVQCSLGDDSVEIGRCEPAIATQDRAFRFSTIPSFFSTGRSCGSCGARRDTVSLDRDR